MYHSFLISKGDIKLLCNGRHPFAKDGSGRNRYTGEPRMLLKAMDETEENQRKKYLVPQSLLKYKIDCKKCKSLQGTRKDRAKAMKFFYKHAPTYKSKVSSDATQRWGIHMEVLGSKIKNRYAPTKQPQTFTFSKNLGKKMVQVTVSVV